MTQIEGEPRNPGVYVGESLIYTATSKQGAKKVSSSSAHRIGTKRPEGGAIRSGAIREILLSMRQNKKGAQVSDKYPRPRDPDHIGWLHLMF